MKLSTILKVLLILLVLAGSIMFGKYYVGWSEKETITQEEETKKLLNEFSDEELKEFIEKMKRSSCDDLVNELKGVSGCVPLRKVEDKDICYFCFATIEKNQLLCEKISDESQRNKCQEEFTSE